MAPESLIVCDYDRYNNSNICLLSELDGAQMILNAHFIAALLSQCSWLLAFVWLLQKQSTAHASQTVAADSKLAAVADLP